MDSVVMSAKATRNAVAVVCVTVLGLVTFGMVMLTSTSSFYPDPGEALHFAERQAMWLGLGLGACVVTAFIDYRWYRKLAWPLFIGAVLLLVGVLIYGKPVNGSTRWLVHGPFRFQPSEFAKFALVIFLAFVLETLQRAPKGRREPRIQRWGWGVLVPLAITTVVAGLVLKESDLGMTLLMGAVALLLMWVGGVPSRRMAGMMVVGLVGVAAFLVAILRFDLLQDSYQVRRIVHWWRWDDLYGVNYQQYMGILALGSGGVWGQGLGDSRLKMAYLPEAHTDFIFPVVGEELGLIATLAVVAAFCVMVVGGIRLASRSPDLFGVLLGSGIIALIGMQALINMAVAVNAIPNKGMPLPFISYGGSNLVMTLAALGVVLNIAGPSQERLGTRLEE